MKYWTFFVRNCLAEYQCLNAFIGLFAMLLYSKTIPTNVDMVQLLTHVVIKQ